MLRVVLVGLVVLSGCSSHKITSSEMIAAIGENRDSINSMSQVLVNVLGRVEALENRVGDDYVEAKSANIKP